MKFTFKNNIERSFCRAKRAYKIHTQTLRQRLTDDLMGLFQMASAIAKGKVKRYTVGGKQVHYTLKQREKWARVAGYLAQIIDGIARNFDEREVDLMLAEAERLIHEAKQLQENQGLGQGTSTEEASTETNTTS